MGVRLPIAANGSGAAVLVSVVETPDGRVRVTLDELRASTATVVSVAIVASLLGVNERTVRRACDDGQLPIVRVGTRTLIVRERLVSLLMSGELV
ncbi:helix-turn-helix domain-containing protein [Lacisediminihabitans profunda]|uniref:Helix-turn-helix domain-containing protein n=1 Tax=Lacisediminihabitans profunda TaxID=2594790 RepID=A0A5C8UP84_9MICO|nr:helix-turn-helix domain-containing protein [Lacisediminihabitans profunda]